MKLRVSLDQQHHMGAIFIDYLQNISFERTSRVSVSLEPDQRQMWRTFPDLVTDHVHLEAGLDTI